MNMAKVMETIDFYYSPYYNVDMKTDLAYVIGVRVNKDKSIELKFEIIGKKQDNFPILVLSKGQVSNLPVPDRIVNKNYFDLRDLIGVVYSIRHENGKVYYLRVIENAVSLPDKPIDIKGGEKDEN